MTTPRFAANRYPTIVVGPATQLWTDAQVQHVAVGDVYVVEETGQAYTVIGTGLAGAPTHKSLKPLGLATQEQALPAQNTTTNTPVTVVSFAPPAVGTYFLSIRVLGEKPDGTAACWFNFSGAFRFQGGATSSVGTTTKTTQSDAAVNAATCVESVGGAGYAVIATGQTAVPMKWRAWAAFYQLS